MDTVARVLRTGHSQAVRLPAAFRFDTKEVVIRRDEATGDAVVSRRPADWSGLLAAVASADDESAGLLAERGDPAVQPLERARPLRSAHEPQRAARRLPDERS